MTVQHADVKARCASCGNMVAACPTCGRVRHIHHASDRGKQCGQCSGVWELRHGTPSRGRKGCKCDACVAAYRVWERTRRARIRAAKR